MRRLSEILAFPRAWYRRSIARRLFLGDQTINLPGYITIFMLSSFSGSYWIILALIDDNRCVCLASGPATPDSVESIAQHLSPESSRKAYWRTWDGQTTQHPSSSVFSDATTSHAHLKSPATGRTRSVSDSSAPRRGEHAKLHMLDIFCVQGSLWAIRFNLIKSIWCHRRHTASSVVTAWNYEFIIVVQWYDLFMTQHNNTGFKICIL